jgi:hypothetical protein
MKKLALAAALIGAGVTATPAFADQSKGRIKAYSNGTLTVINAKTGIYTYKVNTKTDCGVSYGQSGDSIPCKTLGAAKYDRRKVTVRWTRDSTGKRVASLVAVDLSQQ